MDATDTTDTSGETAAVDTSATDTAAAADTTVEKPADDVLTLKLKQPAFWVGEYHEAGTTFTYARAEAQDYLAHTDLFEAA